MVVMAVQEATAEEEGEEDLTARTEVIVEVALVALD